MHLSLLSEGYVSDSFNDAGPIISLRHGSAPSPLHFLALCRGLVVLFALALPIIMTILANTTSVDAGLQDASRSVASPGAVLHAKNG